MAVDLKAIDAKIRKLQKLRELLADDETRQLMADPEIMTMFRESVSTNGNGTSHAVETVTREDENGLPAAGSLRRTILETARGCSGKFDARYIVEKMKLQGFHFNANDPLIAANQALRNLERLKLVRLVRKGSGRLPHIYEAVRREEPVSN